MGTNRSSTPMMVRDVIAQTGAEIKGHFAVGPYHTEHWIRTELMLAKPQHTANLCRVLAMQLLDYEPDVVLGIAPHGNLLAHAVGATLAAHLEGDKAIGLHTAHAEADFRFASGRERLIAGRAVALVQDVIFTGKVTSQLMALVTRHGGRVVAVGALIQRGQGVVRGDTIHGVPFRTLFDYGTTDNPAEPCPQCAAGEPVVDPRTMASVR